MIIFRAQKKDSDDFIEGYYQYNISYDRHIINHVVYAFIDDKPYLKADEIKPETLSFYIDILDSNNVPIFTSFKNNGVMTNGGDVVEFIDKSMIGDPLIKAYFIFENGCIKIIRIFDYKPKNKNKDNFLYYQHLRKTPLTVIGKQCDIK